MSRDEAVAEARLPIPASRPALRLRGERIARPRRLLCLFLLLAASTRGLELPPVFGDHMVLQRDHSIRVWGDDAPGTTVRVDFAGCAKSVRSDPTGRWAVELDPTPACSSGRVLSVVGTQTIQLSDVLVGEVWLCTGQSNMRFMLRQATGGAEAIRQSGDTGLRLLNFTGTLKEGTTAQSYFSTSGWQPSSPASSPDFSAVAWFFGQGLRRELGVPIGLILNAVGGAPIESFLPPAVISADASCTQRTAGWTTNTAYPRWCRERAAQEMAKFRTPGFHPFAPSALHVAGLAPLQPFALRGILWYQGESNATDTPETPALDPAPYAHMFTALVNDWRRAWSQPDLPVCFVQLPALNRDWAAFRTMQAGLTNSLPHCGMVATLDLGHPTDVHPPNKKPVGERLAARVLRDVYNHPATD